ncbi:MAG TPA: hypothetical protein VFV34_16470, partial [Blastocatellia bacterium]|nr:hypothetical protein [Blastocatellia bacterium]
GTLGRLTKWTGFTGSNSVIGDTTIYEDKFGKVGIGTDSPTSKLTVVGTIEATGGFKFPDGTVQTSSSTGALFTVAHDATLKGDGTTASPLGVAVPLVLNGLGGPFGVIQAANTTGGGDGVSAVGGNGLDFGIGLPGVDGGDGVHAVGGRSTGTGALGGVRGGDGVSAVGGDSDSALGGSGVSGQGGNNLVGGRGGRGGFFSGGTGSGALQFGGVGIEVLSGLGINGAAPGLAGNFNGAVRVNGNVQVTGTLSKGGGAFKIDHPLDPENKYLSHSFVESPDMMNIYNGNVTTDANGDAVVNLPDYFDALNKDFRYQLTVIGTFAQAIVAEEVTGNRFAIKTNAPNVRVSWQVTGIRHDAFANKNRIPVEEDKPEVERGYYLHPDAFDQPEEKLINWVRDPDIMKRLKQRRIEAEQMRVRQPNQP